MNKVMNRIFIFILIGLVYSGCSNYENQERYEVKVGETVKIYYSTNSCCYSCIPNNSELKHVRLLEEKTVDPGPSDCAGCDFTAAYIFKAETPGIDTVQLRIVAASMDCNSMDATPNKYIIEVK